MNGIGNTARCVAAACAAVLAAACSEAEPSGPQERGATAGGTPWFEPVEDAAGVDFVHVRGPEIRYWFPEIMSGGAALFDADGDGDLDLYLVQGGDLDPRGTDRPTNRLYENRGDGTFADVTDRAGVGDDGYGMGAACGDVDGDGDVDLYVTNVGPNVLYRNEGDGTFTDVTGTAGVGHPGWGTSAAFCDVDGDGLQDLVVINYLNWSIGTELVCELGHRGRDYCAPNNYERPAMDVLYRNQGDGTFRDTTEEAGLHRAFGNGLGLATGDFDGDGRIDLYVTNDGMENQLWINQGEGRFEDRGLLAGCAVNRQGAAEAGMGVAAVDIDVDGDLDLFMTHLRGESNTFYLNERGSFEDTTAAVGLSGPSINNTGFGMGFCDFDGDGLRDLYVANGRVGRWEPYPDPDDPYAEPDQLFRGLGGGRFEEVRPAGGTAGERIETGRAAAFGDLDDDGAVDVVVVNSGGRARILRNVAHGDRSWIGFRVLDRHGRDALGARVDLVAGGRPQTRRVQTAYSYCASNDPRVHFGLDRAARADEVTITWPGGRRESFGSLAAGQLHELREGGGQD